MNELNDQIKGAFDGDNSAEFITGLTEMLQEKGLKVLDEKGEQALFTGYTDKNFERTREYFGKQGQDLYKDEEGKDLPFWKQYTTDIESKKASIAQQAATIKSMQTKLDSITSLEGADNEALKAAKQQAKEYEDLFKAQLKENETFKAEFESKAKEQRIKDLLNGSTKGFKYSTDANTDKIESAKNYAFHVAQTHAQEFRDDQLVFLGDDGDALRDSEGKYVTVSDIVKKNMLHVLDTQVQATGLGSKKNTGDTGGDPSVYVMTKDFKTKSELLNDVKAFGLAKGVEWHKLQPVYRQLASDNNLQ